MTRARRVALALGVPACLALTAWGAFAIVGEIGQGHFPVSAAIPVSGGKVTARKFDRQEIDWSQFVV